MSGRKRAADSTPPPAADEPAKKPATAKKASKGKSLTKANEAAIHLAALEGNTAAVALLIERGASVDAKDKVAA